MRNFDLSPLFRSTVGFDHLARALDAALEDSTTSYPPYNIEKLGDEDYRITMAVAGFSEEDLDITAQDNLLVIKGRAKREEGPAQYLHRGIAGRSFERRFNLADHIRVQGARLENGLLHVNLLREVPEAMRPRKIAITQAAAPQRPSIEHDKAA